MIDKILHILEHDIDLKVTSHNEDLDMDSMDEVQLVCYLEEDFKIQIPDDDVQLLNTVNNIIGYIEAKLKEETSQKQQTEKP